MSTRQLGAAQHNRQVDGEPTLVPEATQLGAEATEPTTRVKLRHVLLLGSLTAFGPLSTDMYLPALPAVSQDLSTTMSPTQLSLTAGILGLALGQMIAGPLSDARGRRWPLIIGTTLFVLASLLCSIAPSIAVLTTLRFVQGLAGAAGVVIALAMARDLYAGNALARCISLLMTVNFLAPIVAPVLGGQVLKFADWRGIFVVIALMSGMILLASTFSLGETLAVDRRQRSGSATTVRSFAALLSDRRFVGYALACGFAFAAGIVYISVSPFVLQTIYGLSPQHFSLLFGINALGLAGMGQISARLVGRVSPRALLTMGVIAIAGAAISLPAVVFWNIGLLGIVPAFFVISASLGLIAPNATALALATTTPRMGGSASALLGVIQLSIGAIIAPLVGIGGTTTAAPMAGVIAGFGIATLVTFIVLCRPAQEHA